MLTKDQLANALTEAKKAAECGKWCVVGSEIEEGHYKVWHQGIRDADVQIIYAPAVLGLYEVGLKPKLQEWIVSLHKRVAHDLNETAVAGFATGGVVWTHQRAQREGIAWLGESDERPYATSAD